ncbi:MAG: hypothetical protein LBQ84_06520 [Flavobacteriaceae bacterium]|jgi:hypothetical protein|nr:hypothetical protein [Flavobacteriaceae bacterium]
MSGNSSLRGLLVAISLCVISVLIYKFFIEKNDEFLLDNPTEDTINVIFNGENYLLASGQTLKVSVHQGKNTISSVSGKDGKAILKDTFFTLEKTNRGLINPTGSTYYTFRRYYGHIKNIDSLYKANKTIIGGKEYVGEIKEYKDLVLQDFYFNVNEDFPKVINKVDTMESRVKLFRKTQFLEFYQSTFE